MIRVFESGKWQETLRISNALSVAGFVAKTDTAGANGRYSVAVDARETVAARRVISGVIGESTAPSLNEGDNPRPAFTVWQKVRPCSKDHHAIVRLYTKRETGGILTWTRTFVVECGQPLWTEEMRDRVGSRV